MVDYEAEELSYNLILKKWNAEINQTLKNKMKIDSMSWETVISIAQKIHTLKHK